MFSFFQFLPVVMFILSLARNHMLDFTVHITDALPESAIYAFIAFFSVFMVIQLALISICVCSLLYSIENNKRLNGGA